MFFVSSSGYTMNKVCHSKGVKKRYCYVTYCLADCSRMYAYYTHLYLITLPHLVYMFAAGEEVWTTKRSSFLQEFLT